MPSSRIRDEDGDPRLGCAMRERSSAGLPLARSWAVEPARRQGLSVVSRRPWEAFGEREPERCRTVLDGLRTMMIRRRARRYGPTDPDIDWRHNESNYLSSCSSCRDTQASGGVAERASSAHSGWRDRGGGDVAPPRSSWVSVAVASGPFVADLDHRPDDRRTAMGPVHGTPARERPQRAPRASALPTTATSSRRHREAASGDGCCELG